MVSAAQTGDVVRYVASSWREEDHPRGPDSKWISKHELVEAAGDLTLVARDGAGPFHAYATAHVNCRGRRFPLALTVVERGEKMEAVIRYLQAARYDGNCQGRESWRSYASRRDPRQVAEGRAG